MEENEHFIPDNAAKKPPKRLFGAVMGRLKIEKILKAFKGRFLLFLVILTVSVILGGATLLAFRSELAESESGPFFSLLFSDTGATLSYFKYFVLALLESIPVMAVVASLTVLVLAMISLRFAVAYHDKISILKLKLSKSWN